jgi:integrase
MAAGIEARHARSCRTRTGGRCNCEPSYRAEVWSKRDKRRIRKTFDRGDAERSGFDTPLKAAKAWRQEALVALRRGTMRPTSPLTLERAAENWLAGARDGSIRNRSGARYKPSAIRGYDQVLDLRVLPALGGVRLTELRLTDVQDFADSLLPAGLDPSTIRNTLMPLRAIYRRALSRGDVAVNPTTGLELPAVRGRRDRVVPPEEASALLEALPAEERPLWATALYAGLRRGELMGLRWVDVDLASGVLRVERAWDEKEREPVEPKSHAGRRRVPIPAVLRDHLVEHRMNDRGEGLVFGRTAELPFNPKAVRRRALEAWNAAELEPITLHEGRHAFASLMIAAGVNAKALSTYMGHASVRITLDLYGHLMPGNESEAAELLGAYLARSAGQVRGSSAPREAVESG